MNTEFSIPVRVYIEDTDAGGIVYYVNYLKFMERARSEFIRLHGCEQSILIPQGLMFVVHSLDTRYLRPAVLDDLLRVTVSVIECGKSYLLFEQKVFDDKEQLLCEGRVKVACVSTDKKKPKAIPADMRASLLAI